MNAVTRTLRCYVLDDVMCDVTYVVCYVVRLRGRDV
jgi:hypothetical protein